MTDSIEQIARKVHEQYEELPYPVRDPAEERKRLIRTDLTDLDVINHYCFKGRHDFTDGFNVLVAGGGTGDATIYLAEQLKDTNAAITYVDISRASLEIARKRAEVRGLENITFINGSLLDLPTMEVPKFDYIDCSGVLHHLTEPKDGLAALRGVLKDDGAMFLMLYGKYGRTAVYQIQELMRLVNTNGDDVKTKLANTRTILASLPESNWFKRARYVSADFDSDAGLYDLFLHSQDRSYSVGELYDLLDAFELNLVTFCPAERMLYNPRYNIRDQHLLQRVGGMTVREQQAFGELFCGAVAKHQCYVSPQTDTVASIDELENIPTLHVADPGKFASMLDKPAWPFRKPNLPNINITPGKYVRAVFRHIDGKRNLKEILRLAAKEFTVKPSQNEIMSQFKQAYNVMVEWGDLILLRAPESEGSEG